MSVDKTVVVLHNDFIATSGVFMTRINVVPVGELCNQHLMAEHREMTRIPNMLNSGKLQVVYRDAPTEYTLGAGHVKFFVDKLGFLKKRYDALHQELLCRGYSVSHIWPSSLPKYAILGEYTPTAEALSVNRERIKERLPKNAKWCKVNKSSNN